MMSSTSFRLFPYFPIQSFDLPDDNTKEWLKCTSYKPQPSRSQEQPTLIELTDDETIDDAPNANKPHVHIILDASSDEEPASEHHTRDKTKDKHDKKRKHKKRDREHKDKRSKRRKTKDQNGDKGIKLSRMSDINKALARAQKRQTSDNTVSLIVELAEGEPEDQDPTWRRLPLLGPGEDRLRLADCDAIGIFPQSFEMEGCVPGTKLEIDARVSIRQVPLRELCTDPDIMETVLPSQMSQIVVLRVISWNVLSNYPQAGNEKD